MISSPNTDEIEADYLELEIKDYPKKSVKFKEDVVLFEFESEEPPSMIGNSISLIRNSSPNIYRRLLSVTKIGSTRSFWF